LRAKEKDLKSHASTVNYLNMVIKLTGTEICMQIIRKKRFGTPGEKVEVSTARRPYEQ
jgi:hypothetical protein